MSPRRLVALAIVFALGLRAGAAFAQEEEGGTCGSDEICSDWFSSWETIQEAWDAGLSWETGLEGEGFRSAYRTSADCVPMTVTDTHSTPLLTLCLSGTATTDMTWQLTLLKLTLGSGGAGYVSTDSPTGGGGGEPSGSATDPSTTAVVSSTPNPSAGGEAITFLATITAVAPGSPTGDVVFWDGGPVTGTDLGTAAVTSVGGVNTAALDYDAPPLAPGTHSITAVYTGDPFFASAVSPPHEHQVDAAGTTTTLTSDGSPGCGPVEFTATVTGPAGPVPTGTVAFYDGLIVIGTAPVDASGEATFETSTLPAGAHSILASYTAPAASPYEDSVSDSLAQFMGPSGADLSPFIALPGTTTVLRSELGGPNIYDPVLDFEIPGAGITGSVQDRVVLSDDLGTLVFYWRVQNDLSSTGTINYFTRSDFAGFATDPDDVGYRIDGLGDVPTAGVEAEAAFQTGGGFRFFTAALGDPDDDIAPGLESRFVFVVTDATTFDANGCGVIHGVSSTGEASSVTLRAVQPR